jgi:hypothetical protein
MSQHANGFGVLAAERPLHQLMQKGIAGEPERMAAMGYDFPKEGDPGRALLRARKSSNLDAISFAVGMPATPAGSPSAHRSASVIANTPS